MNEEPDQKTGNRDPTCVHKPKQPRYRVTPLSRHGSTLHHTCSLTAVYLPCLCACSASPRSPSGTHVTHSLCLSAPPSPAQRCRLPLVTGSSRTAGTPARRLLSRINTCSRKEIETKEPPRRRARDSPSSRVRLSAQRAPRLGQRVARSPCAPLTATRGSHPSPPAPGVRPRRLLARVWARARPPRGRRCQFDGVASPPWHGALPRARR